MAVNSVIKSDKKLLQTGLKCQCHCGCDTNNATLDDDYPVALCTYCRNHHFVPCPKCGSSLVAKGLDEGRYHVCPKCHRDIRPIRKDD